MNKKQTKKNGAIADDTNVVDDEPTEKLAATDTNVIDDEPTEKLAATDTNVIGDEPTEKLEAIDTNVIDDEPIEKQEATIELLQQEIATLTQSVAESVAKVQRAQAELDNVRKRAQRDVENAHKYGLERFIHELLPVLDSLELGIHALENTDDIKGSIEGMNMTMKIFSTALEKSGVQKIAPNAGDTFDPDWHEAMSMQEQEAIKSGAIINTLQKGYQISGRLIRPAKVIIAK